jgi:hypothetical protein
LLILDAAQVLGYREWWALITEVIDSESQGSTKVNQVFIGVASCPASLIGT